MFEERCAELEAYKAEHGHCLVPRNFSPNPRLGRWVNNQRSAKKRLDRGDANPRTTQAQVDQLTALGMVWEVNPGRRGYGGHGGDATWEEQFGRLKAHKALYGHCDVPQHSPDGLGLWVMTQRAAKKALDAGKRHPVTTQARVDKLTALGLTWEIRPGRPRVSFDDRLNELAAYKAEHGDCLVPVRFPANPGLGWWVPRQRKFRRALDRGDPKPGITQERVDRLTAVGMVWDTRARAKAER